MEQKHLATSRKSDFVIIRKNHPKLDYSWAISCTYKAPSTCSPPIHSSLEWWLGEWWLGRWWLGGWREQWHYSPLMQQVAAPFWHTLAFSLEKNQRRMHLISEKHSAITSQQLQSSPCSLCLSSTEVLKVSLKAMLFLAVVRYSISFHCCPTASYNTKKKSRSTYSESKTHLMRRESWQPGMEK